MKNTTEYIITEFTKHNGWCLFHLAGYDREYAEEVLKECQKENPNKELRIEVTNSEDNWWNKYGTN